MRNAKLYTEGWRGYNGLPSREIVHHDVSEYVRGMAHTNGIESFWAMLKRAHKGTFHWLSSKLLHRYLSRFCGRHNIRLWDTAGQMAALAAAMVGHRLPYRELVSGSRDRATSRR